jgi:pimeloyl-ACP methyl ester carboxylesterase
MPDQRITVGTAADRQLEVLVSGPADGVPLVFHTGTPGGLVPCRWVSEAAAAHGLRTVIYARPGYGGSTPQPGRRVADCAADVTAILDRLGAAGWRDDDLAFASDWGFGAGDLSAVPTAIWQGGQDLMVPLAHGAWLGSQVAGASIHLLPGEGHLTLVTTLIGQVLAELISLAGLPPAGGW